MLASRITLLAIAFICLTAGAAHASPTVNVLVNTPAYTDPSTHAHRIMTVGTRQPLTGGPTVLAVRGKVYDRHGNQWVKVLLPGRGHKRGGWLQANHTKPSNAPYRITVSRRHRTATLYRNGRRIKSFRVVVGKASTPTPAGVFQALETVRQKSGSVTGPFVLATNAYSTVLQEFAGGPGQIGLHGRTGLSDPLGTASSHGCIRFADSVIVWLSGKLTPGSLIAIS